MSWTHGRAIGFARMVWSLVCLVGISGAFSSWNDRPFSRYRIRMRFWYTIFPLRQQAFSWDMRDWFPDSRRDDTWHSVRVLWWHFLAKRYLSCAHRSLFKRGRKKQKNFCSRYGMHCPQKFFHHVHCEVVGVLRFDVSLRTWGRTSRTLKCYELRHDDDKAGLVRKIELFGFCYTGSLLFCALKMITKKEDPQESAKRIMRHLLWVGCLVFLPSRSVFPSQTLPSNRYSLGFWRS